MCSHSRETYLQLQLKLYADTGGGGVNFFAVTERGGFSDVLLNSFQVVFKFLITSHSSFFSKTTVSTCALHVLLFLSYFGKFD